MRPAASSPCRSRRRAPRRGARRSCRSSAGGSAGRSRPRRATNVTPADRRTRISSTPLLGSSTPCGSWMACRSGSELEPEEYGLRELEQRPPSGGLSSSVNPRAGPRDVGRVAAGALVPVADRVERGAAGDDRRARTPWRRNDSSSGSKLYLKSLPELVALVAAAVAPVVVHERCGVGAADVALEAVREVERVAELVHARLDQLAVVVDVRDAADLTANIAAPWRGSTACRRTSRRASPALVGLVEQQEVQRPAAPLERLLREVLHQRVQARRGPSPRAWPGSGPDGRRSSPRSRHPAGSRDRHLAAAEVGRAIGATPCSVSISIPIRAGSRSRASR